MNIIDFSRIFKKFIDPYNPVTTAPVVYPRKTAWIKLIMDCEEKGLALMAVPGDGNCMIWSFRALLASGGDGSSVFESYQAMSEQEKLRSQLKQGWISVRKDPCFQHLFAVWNDDQFAAGPEPDAANTSEASQKTPEKTKNTDNKQRAAELDSVDLVTPERVAQPKKRTFSRVGQGKPVPLVAQ